MDPGLLQEVWVGYGRRRKGGESRSRDAMKMFQFMMLFGVDGGLEEPV